MEGKHNEKQSQTESHPRSESTPLYYANYLQLDKILDAQKLESAVNGKPGAHDEMLFIIIHQTYELWFKQIMWELEAVMELLNRDYVPERDISKCVAYFDRITEIQRVLNLQIKILETMTPLNFMDFRDSLFPASGFQSYQFRLLENKLGQLPDRRVPYEHKAYHTKLSEAHQKVVQDSEKTPNLFNVLEKWLERAPLSIQSASKQFDFIEEYKKAVNNMFEEDLKVIAKDWEKYNGDHKGETHPDENKEIEKVKQNMKEFNAIFDEERWNEMIKDGRRRLSRKATLGALLINIYQDEPIFTLPFMLLQKVIDMDGHFAQWRHNHSMMVTRMIGTKLGTGGSSGYHYLRATIEKGRIFADISNLATFLIPRKDVPPLPKEVAQSLGFVLEKQN